MQKELTQIQGKIKFTTIKEATGKKVQTSQDIYNYMIAESKIDRECCWVIHLNTKNHIIEKELVSMGTVNASLIHPREIFRKALIAGSTSIMIVHNHPSGVVDPSSEDVEISLRLMEASKIINVPILDFIIIGYNGHYSFLDRHIGGFE